MNKRTPSRIPDINAASSPDAKRPKRKRKGRPGVLLIILTLIYALFLILLTFLNTIGPERWWLGSVNLFLPQIIWAVPCALLFPWYLLRAWRWTWVPALLLLWVLVHLMGYCFHVPRLPSQDPKRLHLRVMTYNVKWGRRDPAAVLQQIKDAKPDILLLQDATGVLNGPFKSLSQGWNIQIKNQYIVASHYPLTDLEEKAMWDDGVKHKCVKCTVTVGKTPITLYDVHLISPRWALGAVREWGAVAKSVLQDNAWQRVQQAELVAGHVQKEIGPLILTGDLNSPVYDLPCRRLMDTGLRDAFSEAGNGYGFTYGQTLVDRPYMRIDHILVSPEFEIESCEAGGSLGSDHCPVIADISLASK